MKYRRICGLIFALMVSVYAIDFDVIMNRYVDDSTAVLDTSAYMATLTRMYENERQNRQRYVEIGDSVGMAECEGQMKAIRFEVLSMAGLDSTEIDSVEAVVESEGLSGLELGALLTVIGAGIVGVAVKTRDKIVAFIRRVF